MNLEIPSELNLRGDWSLGEEAFETIVSIFAEFKPKRIVEFGSGVSSIRLALAFPDSEIISMDHDENFFKATCALREKWAPESRLEIRHAPLKYQWFAGCRYLSYDKVEIPGPIDAAVIDGPPVFTLRGREACLYQIYDRLKTGGLAILDDYRRAEEKAVVRNWFLTYPKGFDLQTVSVGHSLAILRKTRPVNRKLFVFPKLADNWRIPYRLGVRDRC